MPTATFSSIPVRDEHRVEHDLRSHTNFSGEKIYDLVCIGFGPASLAIAVALHDSGVKARVLFLERQPEFAWHAGMLLPSARMQISFLKDLATFRDPRSEFTFLNYLKSCNRLAAFANLGTFYPLREEFNEYLTWAAGHFTDCVRYDSETVSISPIIEGSLPVKTWNVVYKNKKTNALSALSARHVVVAVGGQPSIPPALQSQNLSSNIIHSSRYLQVPSLLLPDASQKVRIAVIGGGQSAAEIFEDLMSRYSKGKMTLITSGSALKPSDDSPLYVAYLSNALFLVDPLVVSMRFLIRIGLMNSIIFLSIFESKHSRKTEPPIIVLSDQTYSIAYMIRCTINV